MKGGGVNPVFQGGRDAFNSINHSISSSVDNFLGNNSLPSGVATDQPYLGASNF